MALLFAGAPMVNDAGETFNSLPICLTLIVFVGRSIAEMLTVAYLVMPIFSAAVNVMVELFTPVGLLTVSQD